MAQLLESVAERNAGLALLIGRLTIGVLFLPSGFHKLSDPAGTAGYLATKGLPGPIIAWAVLAGIFEFFGSLGVVVGFQTRLAALALALFTVIAAFLGHPYWSADAAARMNQYIHFWKDIAIAGGLLFLFARGAGPISIDRR